MEVFVSDECVICLDAKPTCYAKPCGHMNCCSKCLAILAAKQNPKCPCCRKDITSLHTFRGVADAMDCVAQSAIVTIKTDYIYRTRRNIRTTRGVGADILIYDEYLIIQDDEVLSQQESVDLMREYRYNLMLQYQ